MKTLDLFLKKLGIRDVRDLTAQEKETYKQFEELMEREVTMEDLKKMIVILKVQLEDKLLDPENSEKKDTFLKARIRNLKDMEAFITAPERNRKALEANLKSLTKTN